MLTYDLEKRGKHPIYEYLYLCIRNDILKGTIKAGEKLPSKREMARTLDVALITVENAYAQLAIEGYVTAKEKSGYFVSAGMGESGLPAEDEEIASQSSAQKNEKTRKEWLVDFSSGELRRDAFPFSTWAKLARRVMNDREEAFLTKPESKGVPELREAIAAYLRKAKGISVDENQIIVGPGTEYLHHILLQLLGRSRIVAVEDPGYKKVGQIYEGNGLKCLHVPVDQGGMIVKRLWDSNATLVHVAPAHQFPTGCVMPIGRRQELLAWAKAQSAYVIEDDYDSEFRFDGRPIPTLASLGGERVIYMNTFTKTLAPSIRIAYMVLPRDLTDRYEKKLFYYSAALSAFEQYTLAAFIKEGYYERHVSRMRNYYRQQRDKILTALAQSPMAPRCTVEEHAAGLHFILKVKGLGNDEKWLRRLEEHAIRLSPVASYSYERAEKYQHAFVIYYSDLDEGKLTLALRLMAECLN